MIKYAINNVDSVKFIIPKLKTIEENVPKCIRVTKEEFDAFIEKNRQYIKESYVNTVADNFIVKDFYCNVIACMNYYIEETYYINPELLKLGLETKKYIENKYEKIGEEIIDFGECKPCNIKSGL